MTAGTAVDDLAAYLERLDEPADARLADGEFVIATLESATWAARVIAGAQSKLDEIADAAQAERDRIARWEEEASARHLATIEHLSAMLRFYHETRFREDGGEAVKRNPSTSLKLPHGVTLKSRKQPDAWEVDDDTFVAWARVHAPEFVARKITYAPRVADLKAAVAAPDVDVETEGPVVLVRGEAAPGVTVTKRDRKFDVAVSS